ncbi:hypothetical protein C4J81_13185 [Deltaproteobacteria bacterium Smac51]|nr:hypothetical protein C4J81_13185 [Deltaproteobacteria bacterium Smac51]
MPAKNLRNNILSIVVSLGLSFCLWMALSGQDMSAVDITVPLELANLPSDLVIKSDVPTSVTFQVLANTAQVRFLADRKPHLWVNVSSAREGNNIFPIQTDSLDLPRGVQVRKSSPSLIEFEAARVTSKIVPIRPVVRGHPDPAYELASVIIEPDTAMVQGPQELMDEIEYISTIPIDIDGINNDANLVVRPALIDLDPALMVTPAEIRVFVNLDERMAEKTFTEMPIAIEVSGSNLPNSAIVMEPSMATISVAWPVSARLGLEASAIKVRVQVDGRRLAEEGGEMELPVLVTPPTNVKVTSIEPVNVKITAPGLIGLSPKAVPLDTGSDSAPAESGAEGQPPAQTSAISPTANTASGRMTRSSQ